MSLRYLEYDNEQFIRCWNEHCFPIIAKTFQPYKIATNIIDQIVRNTLRNVLINFDGSYPETQYESYFPLCIWYKWYAHELINRKAHQSIVCLFEVLGYPT